MTTKYFKCKLLTDVVLNASLATEGNMQSLDFIPGSNFLGIVAKELYKETNSETLDIFHSEKVKFGDALISENGKLSYALPFSLFQEKGKQNICDDKVWVHHGTEHPVKEKDGDKERTIQLKQTRSGYLNKEEKFIKKVEKNFALKSAYDAEQRRSKDAAMFGFDSIKAGQEFIFSVTFEDESYFEKVKKALEGTKRLGKSKTAQYGQVNIEEIEKPEAFSSKPNENNQLIIYAESRLCFLNDYGNPTFQPKPKDFGIENKDLDFAWEKCQIRTGSYSPWNAKRNTPDSQRSFIERGSVFVIETEKYIDVEELPKFVGEYQNEGFGRVVYNPEFLNYKPDKNGVWVYSKKLTEYNDKNDKEKKTPKTVEEKIKTLNDLKPKTPLGSAVKEKAIESNKELLIGLNILNAFDTKDGDILLDGKEYKDNKGKKFKQYYITKSQWGNIRKIAAKAESIDEINKELFGKVKADKISSFWTENKTQSKNDKTEFYKKLNEEVIAKILISAEKEQNDGYLMHGVADEKIWGKKKGERRKALSRIIEQNRELGTQFVAKLAAEIAKKQDTNERK